MMSTMLPLPSARMRPTPDSCAIVCRSLSPLPSRAFAALSMKRPTEVVETLAGWSQIRCQSRQLSLDLVPLDGHRRALERNHGAVGHCRAARPVGRGQLDVTRRDEILGDDHRLRIGRDGHVAIDVHDQLRLGALRFDRRDGADLDPGDPHLVAGVDRGGGGEVGGDRLRRERTSDARRRSPPQRANRQARHAMPAELGSRLIIVPGSWPRNAVVRERDLGARPGVVRRLPGVDAAPEPERVVQERLKDLSPG